MVKTARAPKTPVKTPGKSFGGLRSSIKSSSKKTKQVRMVAHDQNNYRAILSKHKGENASVRAYQPRRPRLEAGSEQLYKQIPRPTVRSPHSSVSKPGTPVKQSPSATRQLSQTAIQLQQLSQTAAAIRNRIVVPRTSIGSYDYSVAGQPNTAQTIRGPTSIRTLDSVLAVTKIKPTVHATASVSIARQPRASLSSSSSSSSSSFYAPPKLSEPPSRQQLLSINDQSRSRFEYQEPSHVHKKPKPTAGSGWARQQPHGPAIPGLEFDPYKPESIMQQLAENSRRDSEMDIHPKKSSTHMVPIIIFLAVLVGLGAFIVRLLLEPLRNDSGRR